MSKENWDLKKLSEFCKDAELLIGVPKQTTCDDKVPGLILGSVEYLNAVGTKIDLDIFNHEAIASWE